jgi:Ni/Co efflux regulator RcnB
MLGASVERIQPPVRWHGGHYEHNGTKWIPREETTVMRKLKTLLVISLLASSAAIADPPSRWSRDQPNSMPRHGTEAPGRYREPRTESRPARTENTQRQNEPRQVEARQTEPRPIEPRHNDAPTGRDTARQDRNTRTNEYRNERGYVRDARPETHGDQPRHDDQPRHGEEMNNRSRWTSGNRDERGYSRDPRPGNHSDHDNHGSRDDNNWTRDGDHWRDHRGREWHHDHGWYNDFRGNHFFFNNGRYFARQRFFFGYYNAPWGYSSRLWMRGDILPLPYYETRYFVDDYERFDLYDPPFGARWVRVGFDALLVDTATGEVLDVLHDLFW